MQLKTTGVSSSMNLLTYVSLCCFIWENLNDSQPFCSCNQSGRSGVLCTSGQDGSALFCPLLLWALSFHLKPERLTLLIPGTSHSQWLHQRPDKTQTGPSPSLSAAVKWALYLFVQGEGASWAVMGHNSWPGPRNKWLATHLIFLSFLVLLRFLTHKTAINHCQYCIYIL